MKEFKLWPEFEEVEPTSWDNNDDFATMHIDLPQSKQYGINVWTFQFFET